MRDHHDVALQVAARIGADALLHALGVLAVAVGLLEHRRERVPILRFPEREHRRLAAAAPRAGVDLADGHALALQALADAPHLVASCVRKVSLRRAIVEPEPGRIPQAGKRAPMADEDHVPAAAKLVPQFRIVHRPRGSAGEREEREEEPDQTLTAGLSV